MELLLRKERYCPRYCPRAARGGGLLQMLGGSWSDLQGQGGLSEGTSELKVDTLIG